MESKQLSRTLVPESTIHEKRRILGLNTCSIVDSEPEAAFDELTTFACAAFGVDAAQITFVAEDKTYVKSSAGLPSGISVPREHSFCPHALNHDGPLIVLNALEDARFAHNPYVNAEPNIRFYAGAPLLIHNALPAGSFCILDRKPRLKFSNEEKGLLQAFASKAAELVKVRRDNIVLNSARSQSHTSNSAHGVPSCIGMMLISRDLQVEYANPIATQLVPAVRNGKLDLCSTLDRSVGPGSVIAAAIRLKRKVMAAPLGESGCVRVECYPTYDKFAVFLHTCKDVSLSERRAQARFKMLMRSAKPLFWTARVDGALETELKDWLDFTGQDFRGFAMETMLTAVHPHDRRLATQVFARCKETLTPLEMDLRIRRHDGIYRWLDIQLRPSFDANHCLSEWIGCAVDISDGRHAVASVDDHIAGTNSAVITEAAWEIDFYSKVLHSSSKLGQLFGSGEEAHTLPLQECLDRIHPKDLKGVQQAWLRTESEASKSWEAEFRALHSDGRWRWVMARAFCEHDEHGRLSWASGTASDITPFRLKDSLTGLDNRDSILDHLQQRIREAHSGFRNFAVYFVDLNGFKRINDSLGHAVGDAVLIEVGKRLQSTLAMASGCVAARLSADEFVVLIGDLATAEDAVMYGELLDQTLAEPFSNSETLYFSASIGIAYAEPGTFSGAEEMLESAHMAMCLAKTRGKSACEMFHPTMRTAALARISTERDLITALRQKQFSLYYQPKVDMITGALKSVEALIRWRHPVRGMVSPAEFIPVAEETGLIVPIGEWVFEEASKQLNRWIERGVVAQDFTVAVNCSPRQLREWRFCETLIRQCQSIGLEPNRFCLEITEGVLLENLATVNDALHFAVRSGFGLDLDDFGTGYSSLSYLYKFPFRCIKIDRSFVNNVANDPKCRSLVSTVINLARSLNFDVISEGVETAEQRDILLDLGCRIAQGYFYAPALPAEVLEEKWLALESEQTFVTAA